MDLCRARAIIRSLADQTRMITSAFCDVGCTGSLFLYVDLIPQQLIVHAPLSSLLAFNNVSRIIESHYEAVRCASAIQCVKFSYLVFYVAVYYIGSVDAALLQLYFVLGFCNTTQLLVL